MRRRLIRAVVFLLAGCGLLGCLGTLFLLTQVQSYPWATATVVPTSTATYLYRKVTEARGAALNIAIEHLYAGCQGGMATVCARALADAEAASAEPTRLITVPTPPPDCSGTQSVYRQYTTIASNYRAAIRQALDGGDVAATDRDQYRIWTRAWGEHTRRLRYDLCRGSAPPAAPQAAPLRGNWGTRHALAIGAGGGTSPGQLRPAGRADVRARLEPIPAPITARGE